MIISFSLPTQGKCLLKPDQNVDFLTPFLEKGVNREVTISVADKLAIKPAKIFQYLKKLVGESIQKGEILAQKKNFWGQKTIFSEFDGIIKEVDHLDGHITLITTDKGNQPINAYFKGTVKKVTQNMIDLEVAQAFQATIISASGNFGGETAYFKNKPLNLTALEVADKIVVTEAVSAYFKAKIQALGSRGVIFTSGFVKDLNIPFAQVKKIDDFKKIMKNSYPYCIVDKIYSKIIFYSAV